MSDASATRERPTAKGALIALVVGLAALLVIAEVVLRIVMPNWSEFYSGWFMQLEKVPGHSDVAIGRPKFDGYFAQNNGDFRVHLKINDFGLRNNEPISAANDRIWFVGDSMTFGWGVEGDETYAKVAQRVSRRLTYNVASPGTNICGYQTHLARIPEGIRPRAVVVGLILENDVIEYDCPRGRRPAAQDSAEKDPIDDGTGLTLLDLKIALTRHLALYNFFAVSLKRVSIINDALIGLGLIRREHSQHGQLVESQIDALADSTATELQATRAMLPAGTPFVVVISPTRWELRDGLSAQRRLRLAIVAGLKQRGIAFIDLFDKFAAAGFGPTHFPHDGHWSPLGHRIAGEQVAAWIEKSMN